MGFYFKNKVGTECRVGVKITVWMRENCPEAGGHVAGETGTWKFMKQYGNVACVKNSVKNCFKINK